MSGKPIPRARLEAIPFARFNVECQSQLEKRVKPPGCDLSYFFVWLDEEERAEIEEEEATPPE